MVIEILASKTVEKTLRSIRKSDKITRLASENLAKDFIEMSGRVEPKGTGMYGIDLPGGYRTLFCFNREQQPVLVFFGNHAEYDRISADDRIRMTKSSDTPLRTTLSSPQIVGDVPLEKYVQNMKEAGPLSSGKVYVSRNAPASTVREQFKQGTERKEKPRHNAASSWKGQRNTKPPPSLRP
jgi:hypothetical protein